VVGRDDEHQLVASPTDQLDALDLRQHIDECRLKLKMGQPPKEALNGLGLDLELHMWVPLPDLHTKVGKDRLGNERSRANDKPTRQCCILVRVLEILYAAEQRAHDWMKPFALIRQLKGAALSMGE
jgi:hypothetical protein